MSLIPIGPWRSRRRRYEEANQLHGVPYRSDACVHRPVFRCPAREIRRHGRGSMLGGHNQNRKLGLPVFGAGIPYLLDDSTVGPTAALHRVPLMARGRDGGHCGKHRRGADEGAPTHTLPSHEIPIASQRDNWTRSMQLAAPSLATASDAKKRSERAGIKRCQLPPLQRQEWRLPQTILLWRRQAKELRVVRPTIGSAW